MTFYRALHPAKNLSKDGQNQNKISPSEAKVPIVAPSGATYNIVRDWNKLQGFTNSTDSHIQILRDYHHRKVSIQNSGLRPVGIAITTYYSGPKPEIQYVMKPGEDLALAINSHGESLQFIHLLNPETREYVGHPSPLRTKSNMFVLRDGLNAWWVDNFQLAGLRVV